MIQPGWQRQQLRGNYSIEQKFMKNVLFINKKSSRIIIYISLMFGVLFILILDLGNRVLFAFQLMESDLKNSATLKQAQQDRVIVYPSQYKKIKERLMKEKAETIYEILDKAKPQNLEYMYLHMELLVKAIIKKLRKMIRKLQSQVSLCFVQQWANKGFQKLLQWNQSLHCEQSCLKGNIKVKTGLDKHIDKFWVCYLNLFNILAKGYKMFNQWKQAFQLLTTADTICNQIISSSTSNKQILRKVIKVKSLNSSFFTQLSDFNYSTRMLENSLHIALNEIIIKDRQGDYLKRDMKRGRKSYFMYEKCKQTILSLFIRLLYNYQFLQQYDMIIFLIDIIKSLLFEWKIEKSTGIYKLIQKIDSNQCLGWYHDFQSVHVELTYLLNNIFDIEEIRKYKQQRKDATKPKRKIRKMSKLVQELEKSEKQEEENYFETIPNEPQRNSITASLKESKLLVSQPSIGTISQSKGIEASGQMPCTQQLLDFDTLEIVKNKRKTLTYKKQDKKQFQKRNRMNIIDQNSSIQSEQSQVGGYINTILQCSQPKQRFQPYKTVQKKIRKLSLHIQQSFNNVDYQICKIRSRSNQMKPLAKLTTKYELADPKTMKFNKTQIDIKTKHSRAKSIVPKFQYPNTTILHQILFRHKEELDLNRLVTHHMKFYQKAKQKKEKEIRIKEKEKLKQRYSQYDRKKESYGTKQKENKYSISMRRSRDAVKYDKPHVKNMIAGYYMKTKEGIEEMKQEIKGKEQHQKSTMPLNNFMFQKPKNSQLFLSFVKQRDLNKS